MEIKSGKYRSIQNDNEHWDRYDIVLDIKNCEKSYVLKLEKLFAPLGSAPQIEDMFRDKKKVVLRKDRANKHTIRIWYDGTFTIYPYQAGEPYYFEPVE